MNIKDAGRAADGQILSPTQWTAGIVSEDRKMSPGPHSVIENVRIGRHDAFDRIVFQFSDSGIPAYHLEYIDEPVRMCGSGKELYLPGDGWLMIRFSGTRMHENGTATVENRDREPKLPAVLRLVTTCDFEGVVTWVAAVASPNQFRVTELEGPPRVAVDILH